MLLRRLLRPDDLPARTLARVDGYQRSWATVKVDWAPGLPIPWRDASVGAAGTVHIADSVDELALQAAAISGSRIPDDLFVVLGQMTTADPTRSPEGTESAWAYTHVPFHVRDGGGSARSPSPGRARRPARRGPSPGARPGVPRPGIARHVLSPTELERRDANLVEGDNAGGTNQLHQQLVFRPLPGLGRPDTPVVGSTWPRPRRTRAAGSTVPRHQRGPRRPGGAARRRVVSIPRP